MEGHHRLNHFRNHYELTRKDHLLKNVKRQQRALEKEAAATQVVVKISSLTMVTMLFPLPVDLNDGLVKGLRRAC